MKKFRLKNRHRYQRSVGNSELKKLISSPKIVESFDDPGKDIKLEALNLINDSKKERMYEFKNENAIRYSDEFKKAVIMEVLDGLSKDGAMRKYGIGGHTTVLRWVQQYENSLKAVPIQENQHRQVEKSLKEVEYENRRLRKELELSNLKVRELNVIIDTAEINTEVPIRKLLSQDSYNYSKEMGKRESFLSLRQLSTTAKRFTIKVMELVGM